MTKKRKQKSKKKDRFHHVKYNCKRTCNFQHFDSRSNGKENKNQKEGKKFKTKEMRRNQAKIKEKFFH